MTLPQTVETTKCSFPKSQCEQRMIDGRCWCRVVEEQYKIAEQDK